MPEGSLSWDFKMISPPRAYKTMFRASSEIAVAMSAESVEPNPSAFASSRPFWRATTMSISELIRTCISCVIDSAFDVTASGRSALPGDSEIEELEPFLEVQRGGHAFERQAELCHGEHDVWLDADDHRLRAAQP